MMNKLFISITVLLMIGCSTTIKNNKQDAISVRVDQTQDNLQKLFDEGRYKLSRGNAKLAIKKYFNPIIQHFEEKFKLDKQKIYGARSLTESLFYMMKAAAAEKQDAIVISPLWAETYYYKGYANIDMGRIDEAEKWVKRALELSPLNSNYLSELGYIYQTRKNNEISLDYYLRAEEAAKTYSPESEKDFELARALRGSGFILIEMNQLDAAQTKFEQCLELDSFDSKAQNELKYIQQLRNK